jgi:hypothetical protein
MFKKQPMLYEMQVVLVWFIAPPMFGLLVILFNLPNCPFCTLCAVLFHLIMFLVFLIIPKIPEYYLQSRLNNICEF